MNNAAIKASPKKLYNGTWGAVVQNVKVAVGQELTIYTRAGKFWKASVARIVHSGKDYTIVATQSVASRPAASC